MTPTSISLVGETLMLLPEGAVFLPAARMLIVADLHFEKSTSRREFGLLLPPYDTALTLNCLMRLVTQWRPDFLVALGDSFHDIGAPGRLSPQNRDCLGILSRQTKLLWITGNHDPGPATDLPGMWHAEHHWRSLVFRHIPSEHLRANTGELAGHFHPKASLTLRGHTVTRPCFVSDENRLILPAFGAYTGGLDVQNPAIAALFPGVRECYLLGKDRLYRSASYSP